MALRTSFFRRICRPAQIRYTATAAAKKEGDISDFFLQLSGQDFQPLPQRFADLKSRLIASHEDKLQASWDLLLRALQEEIPMIASVGSEIVPEIDFSDLDNASSDFKREHKKRGVAVIRNVIPEKDALHYKSDIRAYIQNNPNTKAFPSDNPQVFELYWSSPQIKARAHPNLLKTQRFLMQFWHSADPDANVSSDLPISYADRFRIRLPGDSKFALGPHVDGGSCERWEEGGYGLGQVYEKIFSGHWQDYDPYETSCRLPVRSNLYNGSSACSMFRMYQGWLSMSHTGPGEGTLLVNPLLSMATAYYLLRPFFSPARQQEIHATCASADFLHPSNWKLDRTPDSWLQGASPGHGQELTPLLHPHLDLQNSLVHVPRVAPGDYVAWHCDTIHSAFRDLLQPCSTLWLTETRCRQGSRGAN